jgi:integrase/recombinase XerD
MSAQPAPLRAVRLPRPEKPLLDEWEMFGLAAGWRHTTVASRRAALEMWQRRTGIPLEQMTARDLAVWLSTCKTPTTRVTYYNHARSYFRWLQASGNRDDDPSAVIPRPKTPRPTPRPVPTVALEAALAIAGRHAYTYIVLGAYAGLRVHEVAKIRGDDLDLVDGTLWVHGKGGQDATIPLHRRIAQVSRGYPDRGYWFPGQHGTAHIAADSVSRTVRNTFTRAGYPTVNAHQLRHWFGTHVLRSAGGNLRVAQECLRHSSPATTMIYTLVEDGERRKAVEGLPG